MPETQLTRRERERLRHRKEILEAAVELFSEKGFYNVSMQEIAQKAPEDEIDKIRSYVETKGQFFTANIPMIRLYFAETRGASFNIKAGLDCEIRKLYEDFLLRLASIFETGIKKKRFKKIADPYYLAVALDSLTNAFLFLWLEDPERHPYRQNVEKILQIFFKNLLNK